MSSTENITDSNLYGDNFRRLFPINIYKVSANNSGHMGILTAGNAVCNLACLQYKHLLKSMTALEEFLDTCIEEKQKHGISSLMTDTLFDNQDKLALLYNNIGEQIKQIDLKR